MEKDELIQALGFVALFACLALALGFGLERGRRHDITGRGSWSALAAAIAGMSAGTGRAQTAYRSCFPALGLSFGLPRPLGAR